MVLLQVDANRVALFPFEGNAPGPVDVQTVALRLATQRVKVEPRNSKILKILGFVQNVQAPKCPSCKIGSDSATGALLEKLLEALMPEAPNHGVSVTC